MTQEIDRLIEDLEKAGAAMDLETLSVIDTRIRPVVDALMASVNAGTVNRIEASRRVEKLMALHLDIGQKVAAVRREAAKGLFQTRSENKAATSYLDTQKLK